MVSEINWVQNDSLLSDSLEESCFFNQSSVPNSTSLNINVAHILGYSYQTTWVISSVFLFIYYFCGGGYLSFSNRKEVIHFYTFEN